MSRKQRKQTPAQRRAEEALDQIAKSSSQPTKKVLDFLLAGSHDAPNASITPPVPNPDQSQARPTPDRAQTNPRPDIAKHPVAPERDFNRRANSLERVALPAGIFPGASKKLYDALYVRTRGAVKPTRAVQATRRELMQWSGIKNIKTINVHVRRLGACGLIKHIKARGDHEGSLYEVFLPEEVDPDPTQTNAIPDPNRKTVSDQSQILVWVGSGNHLENTGTSASPNTSFKTDTIIDDEDLTEFELVIREGARKIVGGVVKGERERWGDLARLLVRELESAAAKTERVSSVPAFLTVHLRRRLLKTNTPESKAVDKRDGETKESSAPSRPAAVRIAPAEIAEQARLIAELLDGGYTFDQAEEQFAMSFHVDDWDAIKSELSGLGN